MEDCKIIVRVFIPQGDLHEFLVAHSPTCDVSVSGTSDDGTISTLEQSDFLYIATQIAAGNVNL